MTSNRLNFALAAAMIAALPLAACGSDAPADVADAEKNASVDTLTGAIPADSRFAAALKEAGLSTLFEGPEPYTVLLPPDEAFPDTLPKDKEELAALLTMHILPGTILGEDINAALERENGGSLTLPTYGGSDLTLERTEDGSLTVSAGGAPVRLTPGDGALDNGALHRIDGLLTS